jgi:hypothetical protein
MLRGTMFVDAEDAEAKLSESPPDSNAQRKRALRESSGTGYDRTLSSKRAKTSEQGDEGGVGTSPHARTHAWVPEGARRGSQHGE